jgi:hypothetical protein
VPEIYVSKTEAGMMGVRTIKRTRKDMEEKTERDKGVYRIKEMKAGSEGEGIPLT